MSEFQTDSVIADQYRVLKRLGRGSFGQVYLVEDTKLPGMRVALKILTGADEDGSQLERFRREALLLAELAHPAIVTFRHFIHVGTTVGYTMDYLDGPTLKRCIEIAGRFDIPRAIGRTREILSALSVAHERMVIHRDMKPANVLIAQSGTAREQAKVLDFGIAKLLGGGGMNTVAALGTPAYMAPEQITSQGQVDARADLYAVGCVLFEMLTGRLPFLSEHAFGFMVQHGTKEAPRLAEAAPDADFPDALEAIVRCALEKEPAARYQSAAEMIAALDAFATSGDVHTRPPIDEASLPPVRATLARACLHLPADASSEGIRRLFVMGGRRIQFGRSRPGQKEGTDATNLVLRVLPDRGPNIDPESFAANRKISAVHGTIEEHSGVLWLTDRSRGGIWLGSRRLEAARPIPLSGSFRLNLSGALALALRVVPEQSSPSCPAEALIVQRVDNEPGDAYLWVLRKADLGPLASCVVRVPSALAGRIVAHDGLLQMRLPTGIQFGPCDIGDETRIAGDVPV